MTKQKTSKLESAKLLALLELEGLIEFIRTTNPDLNPAQVWTLTAFVLNQMPQLFQENPELFNRLKVVATKVIQKRV
ncbi:hypothetical protein [Nostoc sp. NMS9]|uniref:hypothetical protein n=1 Tax=Nostoc sp. NMS9 TaxID=2815393 RepID=UPI0025FAB65E|nr:hypothetical protein [Nostoc sp. NMS9]MBN3940765.1 hypothetical protein [Nostoc sp. NMS9]